MVCRLDQSQPPVTMSCDRIAFGHAIALRPGRWKMEVGNGSRQWSPVTMGTSSNAVLRMRPPGDRAAAIPTGGDLVGVPSMVGKSIIADRASDVHTPSFSCQRCAHTKLFLPSMCT